MHDHILLTMDSEALIAIDELITASGLAHDEVHVLLEFGVIQPAVSHPTLSFHGHTLLLARRAARLRDDFGLNAAGMALALTYLERIEALEHKLQELEASLPR